MLPEQVRQLRDRGLPAIALGSIVAGVALWLLGQESWADLAWAAGAAVVLVPLVLSTARSLLRGDVGVDAIALVAIVWALALGEFLAAAIVALMMSGGAALEAWAAGRARRELRLLVERAPRIAHRYVDGAVEEVKVDELRPGDVVSVRAGEVVPADGAVTGGEAVLDESALTGEALPVTIARHGHVRSGTANAGDTFDLRVTSTAAESAYAAIVRLVRTAETDRAHFTRLADRYAAYFLPFSLAVAGIAWLASGNSTRGLAVMVVATPCPLILAAPIAFVAGLSRAARAGIIVKGAGALERLGGAKTVLLDKTGTLTLGLARARAHRPARRPRSRRGAAARRLARPDVHPRARREPRGRGGRAGHRARPPDGRQGGSRPRHHRRRRWAPGRRRLERLARDQRLSRCSRPGAGHTTRATEPAAPRSSSASTARSPP